ncbi:MAG: hypothetical protein EOO21_05470, partial [Comamonadaceae bacterium]
MPTASPCLATVPRDQPAPSRRSSVPPRFGITLPDGPGRADAEAFIRDVYRRRYGAEIREFMPVLVTFTDDTGIVAAAGYRDAGLSPLFLERYLAAPVETLLAGMHGEAPHRTTVVEVGHLASAGGGEGRQLIRHLGPHLAAAGFRWVVATITQELRSLFLRLGVTPLTLAAAHPA